MIEARSKQHEEEAEEGRWPTVAGKDEKTDFPIEPPEGTQTF